MQYDPRKLAPGSRRFFNFDNPTFTAGPSRQPRLVVGGSDVPRASQTFGQRLHTSSRPGKSATQKPQDDGIIAMRRGLDGGMEMSFVPKSRARGDGGAEDDDEQDEYSGGTRRRERETRGKIERFGAGMEKGEDVVRQRERELESAEEQRQGRTKRRHPGRSASKNAFRKR
jgi:ribosome biogenesis protein ENP2